MSFTTPAPIFQHLHDDDDDDDHRPHQALELQLRYSIRMIARASNLILYQTTLFPFEIVVFPIPFHQLNNDDPVFLQIYIEQLLSSCHVDAAASELIAGEIASYILHLTEQDSNINFHVVAVLDNVQQIFTPPFYLAYPESVWLDYTPPAIERFRMEKLEENEEDLGNCSICLEEIDCKKHEPVKIPCSHAYHKACIFKWLENCNSCPLCRRPVPLKEDSE